MNKHTPPEFITHPLSLIFRQASGTTPIFARPLKFHAFNLIIDSSIALQPLHQAESTAVADVVVQIGAVSKDGIKTSRLSNLFAQIGEDTVWLNVTDVGRFLIENGNRVTIEPCPEVDESTLKLYLLGSCLGAILHQRGNLVLHATAVRIDDGVALIAGSSGAGKSTTAAVFHQKGFQVIADDVVAIDQNQLVIGGVPQIKLWEDALHQLDLAKDGLELIHHQVQKYSFPIRRYEDVHLPVKAIYFLSSDNEKIEQGFEFHPLEGMDKFNCIRENTYRSNFMEGMGLKPFHLAFCGRIANRIVATRIVRPNRNFTAVQLVDRILEHFKEASLSICQHQE